MSMLLIAILSVNFIVMVLQIARFIKFRYTEKNEMVVPILSGLAWACTVLNCFAAPSTNFDLYMGTCLTNVLISLITGAFIFVDA